MIDISVVAVLKSKSWAVTVPRTIPQKKVTTDEGVVALVVLHNKGAAL